MEPQNQVSDISNNQIKFLFDSLGRIEGKIDLTSTRLDGKIDALITATTNDRIAQIKESVCFYPIFSRP